MPMSDTIDVQLTLTRDEPNSMNFEDTYSGLVLTIVTDHSKIAVVEEIAVSKFKATCLAVIEQVRKTRKPIRITRFGKPLADVVPPSTPERPSTWLGYMAGRGKITGDIISPAAKESEWEVLRD
jgi:antitoxin (DNA-binding transcriptional repressor) of toxin-antitoxin stability system